MLGCCNVVAVCRDGPGPGALDGSSRQAAESGTELTPAWQKVAQSWISCGTESVLSRLMGVVCSPFFQKKGAVNIHLFMSDDFYLADQPKLKKYDCQDFSLFFINSLYSISSFI